MEKKTYTPPMADLIRLGSLANLFSSLSKPVYLEAEFDNPYDNTEEWGD